MNNTPTLQWVDKYRPNRLEHIVNQEEIVKILMDNGVDATFNNNVPIQYACIVGNIKIVELLLNESVEQTEK